MGPPTMASNAVILPPNLPPPGGDLQIVVNASMQLIQNQFLPIVSGVALSAVVQQNVNLVKDNIVAIFGGVLTTAGLSILLPSLFVALVNLVGFTSTGVVGGTLSLFIKMVVNSKNSLCIYRLSCCPHPIGGLCWVYWRHVRCFSVNWSNSCGYTSCCVSFGKHVSCCWGWRLALQGRKLLGMTTMIRTTTTNILPKINL